MCDPIAKLLSVICSLMCLKQASHCQNKALLQPLNLNKHNQLNLFNHCATRHVMFVRLYCQLKLLVKNVFQKQSSDN